MSIDTKPRNFLRHGFIAATGLASLVLALSSNDVPVNSQELGNQPRKLTYEQVQTAIPITPNASPINFQEIIPPTTTDSQFPDKAYPSQSQFPTAPKETIPYVQPKQDFSLGPDGTPYYPKEPQSILTPILEPASQPTPALPRIPMPPTIEDQPSQPVYQTFQSSPKPQVQLSSDYYANQIHRLVSKLSLPESPLATACIGKIQNPNQLERFFGRRQVDAILDCQTSHLQLYIGLDFINSKDKLDVLAEVIDQMYQPAYVDARACERHGEHAGLDSNFITSLEGTTAPTKYDKLAQFSFQYASSLSNQRFPGVVRYKTQDGHHHATGSAKAIKQLRERFR